MVPFESDDVYERGQWKRQVFADGAGWVKLNSLAAGEYVALGEMSSSKVLLR